MSELKHSYEVTGYWRTTPTGKRVWVRQYKKTGTAAEDRIITANSKVTTLHSARDKAGRDMDQYYDEQKKDQAGRRGTSEYMQKKIHEANLKKFNEAANRYINYSEKSKMAEQQYYRAVESSKGISEQLKNDPSKWNADDISKIVGTKVSDIVKDIKEDTKIAVNNFVANAKADVSDVLETAGKAISDGVNAVKSFFSGLFGRKR